MRVAVLVPTYEEAGNVEPLLRALREQVPDATLMVIDDASPDGTADIAERVGEEIGGVDVFRRPTKDGLGNAYREGFGRALAGGHDVLVTLDADFSHDPEVVPEMVAAVERGADLVIGSRYVPGGSTPNWPVHRRLLSRWGNRYTGWVLGIGVNDVTSGFRAYRADTLRAIRYETTQASGYAFMTELARRIDAEGAAIRELPITFRDRVRGTSKMSGRIIVESMGRVTWWGVRDRVPRRR